MRNSQKIKARIFAFLVCLAFFVCAVFTFGFPSGARADEVNKTEQGHRFVQVAAGSDFAIGLTYNGDLYGWSLVTPSQVGDNNASSLGMYYPTIPSKIDFQFRKGPVSTGSGSYRAWGDTDPNNGYHSIDASDRIIQIAATRTTAAFITKNGKIYTWGKDIADVPHANMGSATSPLLLRGSSATTPAGNACPWHTPYIIDYDYYTHPDSRDSLENIKPYSGSAMTNMSIAGGEYNYIIAYSRGTSSTYHTFVWGSLMYGVTNREVGGSNPSYTFDTGSGSTLYNQMSSRRTYNTAISADGNSVTAVAGGYTVGVNSSSNIGGASSLMLKGKNFITTKAGTSSDGYKVVPTTYTNEYTSSGNTYGVTVNYTQGGTNYTVHGAIAGGSAASADSNMILSDAPTGNRFYAVQAGSNIYDSTATPARYAIDAQGRALAGVGENDDVVYTADYAYFIHNDVSLGNDVGYGLAGKSLYAWGDNKFGQVDGATGADPNYATPRQITISEVPSEKGFISVAAGKQLSGTSRAFHNVSENITFDSSDDTGYAAGVRNAADYITGVLDEDGRLFVWSNNNTTPTQVKYGGDSLKAGNQSSSFGAIYSGYGNNLFAVTKLGKLARITWSGSSYNVKMYDEFNSGVPVNGANLKERNWQTVADDENTVRFMSVNVDGNGVGGNVNVPDLGKFTFFVDNGVASQNTVFLNGKDADGNDAEAPDKDSLSKQSSVLTYGGQRQSLVDRNIIGDVYRLLDEVNDGTPDTSGTSISNLTFISDDQTANTAATPLKPVFKFNGTTMTDTQRANMFSYRFVYDNTHGVGFEVTPLQSSKGGTVTVELKVARYDCVSNFNITNNQRPVDNALYYDWKPVTVSFTVDNTAAYEIGGRFQTEAPDDNSESGNSRIPLLDPNNAYNKYYSIAVQDVSTGFEQLVKYLLNGDMTDNSVPPAGDDTLLKAILDYIKADGVGDIGFPDAEKITDGNLNYYLGSGEASRAYNNRYQYLIADRDADLVVLSDFNSVRMQHSLGGNSSAVQASRVPVTVTINDIGTYGIDSDRKSHINTDFDNKYGLYDISFGADGNSLSFTYDIVRFNAVDSTGTIYYRSDALDSYKTTIRSVETPASGDPYSLPCNYINASINTVEYNVFNADFVPTRTGGLTKSRNNVAAVFSSPSVRFKNDSKYGSSSIDEYGDSAATSSYNVVDITITGVPVGTSSVINLSDFIECTSDIFFAFNDKAEATEYTKFNNMFRNETDPNKSIVDLTENKFTFSPVTAANQYFTFYIQRFNRAKNNSTFKKGAGSSATVDEKITLNINYTNIVGVVFDKNTAVANSYNISTPVFIDLLGSEGSVTPRLITEDLNEIYNRRIVISSARSTDSSVLTVRVDGNNNTRINLTPVSSGTATVMFSATVYDKSLAFTLIFNVSGLTTMPDTINLSDVEYIYIDDLQGRLKDSNRNNSLIGNYNVLFGDVDVNGRSKAIYFTDETGAPIAGYPEFIDTISFIGLSPSGGMQSDTRIRMTLKNDAVQTDGKYFIHVKFVDTVTQPYATYDEYIAHNAPIIEVRQAVMSARKLLMQADEDGTLRVFTLDIDCDTPKESNPSSATSDWYTGADNADKPGINDNMRVVIPIRYLLSMVRESDISVEQYRVTLVNAPGAAEYFNYYFEGANVIIKPNSNTPVNTETGELSPITVNVTVTTDANVSANKVMMLSFNVTVKGISETLPKDTYNLIWLVAACVSAGVLLIIFLIMMIVYWNRRAKQRAIIKRNRELIKMRDRIHNKTGSATREELVKSKLKMENPKFAAKYNELKNASQADPNGLTVDNMDLDALDPKGKKKKKKKGGKKSIADLKAELEAKKAAFAQAQDGTFANDISVDAQSYGASPAFEGDGGFGGGPAFDGQGYDGGFGGDAGNGDYGFGSPDGGFGAQDIDGNSIIFDAGDVDDGSTQG